MKSDEITRRLVLVKSLYKLAMEQSRKSQPLNWFSLLMFHDAVELFLEIVSEHLHISKRLQDLRFAKYWDIINTELSKKGEGKLTQRITMEKLNNARVAFKHHGTPPSVAMIDDARTNVTNFLEENTFLIFKLKFPKISLVDLIQSKQSKTSLKEAIRLLKKNKKKESVDKIAVAFEQLIDDYEHSKKDSMGRSIFSFGPVEDFSSENPILELMEEPLGQMRHSLKKLQESVKILGLGLDYRKFVKFKFIISRAILKIPGAEKNIKYIVQRMESKTEGELTDEDISYCIDFIIDSAITLNEFKFEIKPRKLPTIEDFIDSEI